MSDLIEPESREEWKPIPGWSNYEASSLGRIRSLDRRFTRKKANGIGFMKVSFKGRILKDYLNKVNGYRNVSNGKLEKEYVHKLVARTFIENLNSHVEINHKNGNKSDNREINLEWCNRSENCIHKSRVLGIGIGVTHGGCKLSENDVNLAREMHARGNTNKEIMEALPIKRHNLYRIITRKSWTHLKDPVAPLESPGFCWR